VKRTFAFGAAALRGDWPEQEDGFFADPVRGRFALADGFGGRGNGDIAAKLCLTEFRGATGGRVAPDFFERVNEKLLAWNEKRAPAAKGGASLILAEVAPEGSLALLGCGACAALVVRAGRPRFLLTPQAPLRDDPGEPLLPTEALGLTGVPRVECRELPLQSQDLVLLVSSGIDVDSELFLADLAAQVALRGPGDSLNGLCTVLAENRPASAPAWNRAILALEWL
jgi:hypothetical protein